jgi:hypothetical protein
MDPKTEQWRKAAHDVITELAASNSLIVSDMVVAALEQAGMGLNNYSALGGVFTRAAKAGLIVKTDETAPGNRKSHSAKTVWRSLTYKKAQGTSPELDTLTAMITNALEYNAAIVARASLIYAQGHVEDRKYLKRQVADFNKIQDQYTAKNVALVEAYAKVVGVNPNEN